MNRTIKKLDTDLMCLIASFEMQHGVTKVEIGETTLDWNQEGFPVKKGQPKPIKRRRKAGCNGGSFRAVREQLKNQHIKTTQLRNRRES